MSNTQRRPCSVLETETAYRQRKRDTSNELRSALESLPEELLHGYLNRLDTSLAKQRRELSQPQTYGIAAMIIREFQPQRVALDENAFGELRQSVVALNPNDLQTLLPLAGLPAAGDPSQMTPVQLVKIAAAIIDIYAFWGLPQIL